MDPSRHPENNPEAAALACLCSGKGLDIGCGPVKTHPDAIGVDIIPQGEVGTAGGVKGYKSVADLCASGDNLNMFRDGELDYVIARHNLEHYQDPLKALEEWKRVLKPGGILGLVLPDDTNSDTIHLDETHKHVFTPDSFMRIMRYLGGFDLVHVGVCQRNWSFTAIYQRSGGTGPRLDYGALLEHAAAEWALREAQRHEENGEPVAALECWREAAALHPAYGPCLVGQYRMLRRLGRLEEANAVGRDFTRRFPNESAGLPLSRAGITPESDVQVLRSTSLDDPREHRRILLSYCASPVTTGSYIERALRKHHEVLTWGPSIDETVVRAWNLEAIGDRVSRTDLGYEQNPLEAMNQFAPGWKPDLFLWIESGIEFDLAGIEELDCPKACYLIDTHVDDAGRQRLEKHLQWAGKFDFVFLAQRAYVEKFRSAGFNAHWLPLGCDPEMHKDLLLDRVHPIGFVGSLNQPRRIQLLDSLRGRFEVRSERCFLEDMAKVFSQSRIVFNNAINKDLNMRVFEAMACGAMVLTDPAPGSGLEEFFTDRKHLVLYRHDSDLVKIAERWLADDDARARVGGAGQAEVLAHHTYDHRMAHLERIVFQAERHGADKTPPAEAPEEIRNLARSLMTPPRSTMPVTVGSSEPAQRELVADFGRCRIFISAHKFQEARELLAKWVRQAGSQPLPHIGLGGVSLAEADWESAERHFRSALNLAPRDVNALAGLGVALACAGRELEATDAFLASLRIQPSQPGVFPMFIRAATAAGRFSDAREIVRAVLASQPDNAHLLFSCAVFSARLQETEEALRLLDRLERLQPGFPGLEKYRAAWTVREG